MYKSPYTISVWETNTSPETKICNIGSDKMTISARALEPKLQRNINGKMSFSFKMYKECYDTDIGDVITYLADNSEEEKYLLSNNYLYLIVQTLQNRDYTGKYENPFLPLLINERVIKVKWENQWFDFVIKNIQEDSAAKSYTFQCESWLVQELSKQGFNLEFDEKLENNQGSVEELAARILENTNWEVGDIDVGYEYNKESVYYVDINGTFSTFKLPEFDVESITNGRALVFFSSVNGLDTAGGATILQFVYSVDGTFVTEQGSQMVKDSELMNYQINVTYSYNSNNGTYTFFVGQDTFCSISIPDGVSKDYRAKKLVNSLKTIYDPLVDKYCYILSKGESNQILTTNAEPLYIEMNGQLLPIYIPGTTPQNAEIFREFKDTDYNFARYIQNLIANGSTFTNSDGWRKVTSTTQDELVPHVDAVNVKSYLKIPEATNTTWVFNSSIRSSRRFVQTFIKDEIYYFRVKMANHAAPPFSDMKIAQYTDYNNFYPTATTYFTVDSGENWTASGDDFFSIKLRCNQALNLEDVTDAKVGLFFHCSANNIEMEEAQLFKEMKDEQGNVLTPASFDASGVVKDLYYVYKVTIPAPANKDQIKFEYKGEKKITEARPDDGYRYLTTQFQKIRTLTGKESNRFNLLQSLAEKFECWCVIYADHDPDTGVITQRYVGFKDTVGEDQNIGFIYGLDLKTVKRTVDSKQIVTKTIVKTNSNKYGENGFCTISRAKENYPKVNYVFDFGYYINQGLLNNGALNTALYSVDPNNLGYFVKLHNYNEAYDAAANDYEKYKLQYDNLGAYLKVFNSYKESAESKKYQYMLYLFNLGDFVSSDGSNTALGQLWYDAHYSPTSDVYEWYHQYVKPEVTDDLKDETSLNATKYNMAITAAIEAESKYDDQIMSIRESMYGTMSNPQYDYNQDGVVDINDVDYLYSYIDNPSTPMPEGCIIDVDEDGEVTDWDATSLARMIAAQDERLLVGGLKQKIAAAEAVMKEQVELIGAADLQFQQSYGAFIQEGTWSSEDYYNDTLYYLDALDVAYTSARPRITYSIDVLRLNALPGYKNKIFKLGDIAYVEDTDFFGYTTINDIKTPYHEKVVLTELTQNLDDPSKDQFKVQNYRTQFEDLFQRITASVQSLQWNEADYGRAVDAVQKDETFNTDILQSSLNNAQNLVRNSLNNAITQDATGISIVNQNDPSKQSHINAEGFFISTDGGDNWRNAVSAEGIATELLTAGAIDTNRISIMDGTWESFRWDASGLNAYKTQSTGTLSNYGTFVRFDRWGVYGRESTDVNFKPTAEASIWNDTNTKFALTWSGLCANASNGLTSMIVGAMPSNAVAPSTAMGFMITKNTVNNGQITSREKVFYADGSGDLYLKGTITAESGTIGGWNIEEHGLWYGGASTSPSLYLGNSGITAVVNGSSRSNIVFKAGSSFGVDKDGNLYGSAANLTDISVTSLTVSSGGNTLFNANTTTGQVSIGGFTVTATALYNGISSASATSGTGVYLGTDGINLGGVFRVTNAGAIAASSGQIGGFTIDGNHIYSSYVENNNTVYFGMRKNNSTANSQILFYAGSINSNDPTQGSANFTVSNSGTIWCNSIMVRGNNSSIGGFTIGGTVTSGTTTGYIYNGINSASGSGTGIYLGVDGINLGGVFKVDTSGNLTATSATISGQVASNGSLTAGDIEIKRNVINIKSTNGNIEFNNRIFIKVAAFTSQVNYYQFGPDNNDAYLRIFDSASMNPILCGHTLKFENGYVKYT